MFFSCKLFLDNYLQFCFELVVVEEEVDSFYFPHHVFHFPPALHLMLE